MNTSTMFLRKLTQIDMGLIYNGILTGHSYNLSCLVEGSVETDEQVVVDFSTIKKDIKNEIDSKEYGIDHKVVVFENDNNWMYTSNNDCFKYIHDNIQLELPRNAICIIPKYSEHLLQILEEYLNKFLLEKLKQKHPNLVSIKCSLNENVVSDDNNKLLGKFRYNHGLKNSSSWGCQNIAHGHLSFIEIDNKQLDFLYLAKIIEELNNSHFIFNENILEDTYEYIKFGYTTERGYFECKLNKNNNKIILMDKETTIENIVEYVYNRYNFKQYDVKLFVSEGLCKGAVL